MPKYIFEDPNKEASCVVYSTSESAAKAASLVANKLVREGLAKTLDIPGMKRLIDIAEAVVNSVQPVYTSGEIEKLKVIPVQAETPLEESIANKLEEHV